MSKNINLGDHYLLKTFFLNSIFKPLYFLKLHPINDVLLVSKILLGYQAALCGCYNIFKKTLNLFFAHENIKNKPQKLLKIDPKLLFHSTGPPAQTSSEMIFHIMIKYVPRLICLLICASHSYVTT